MRRAWIWIAAVGVAVLALYLVAGSRAPASVWTDGVSVCDRPGGSRVPLACVDSGPSAVTASTSERKAVLLREHIPWTFRLQISVEVGHWVRSNEWLTPYQPADGSEVQDASGVTWWRCDRLADAK